MTTTPDPLTPPIEPNNRRNGKVAQLPKTVRDKINRMILDGITYKEIIRILGPEARDINEDNLTNWRQGGYQDWLRQQQRVDQQQANYELALDLVSQNAGTTMAKAARQIVASQICQLLLDFDPVAVAAALADKPELYTRLINALARLSEGESTSSYRLVLEAKVKATLEKEEAPSDEPKTVKADTLKNIAKELKLLP